MIDSVDYQADSLVRPRHHVLFIAGHFSPESTSGTHRSLHFARSLDEHGIRVSVVTVDRDSLPSVDPTLNAIFPHEERIHRVARRRTLDDFYNQTKRHLLSFRGKPTAFGEHSRVTAVTQAPLPRVHRNSLRKELAGMMGFPDSHAGWFRPAIAAAMRVAAAEPVDAVFASGPPWTGLRVAREVAGRLGSALVIDFRDPWTTSMGEAIYDSERLAARASREEARMVAESSTVLFNSPALMALASRHYPDFATRFRCIINGTDIPANTEQRALSPNDSLVFRHLGSLYGGRSLQPLIDALEGAAVDPAIKSQLAVEIIGPIDHNTPDAQLTGSRSGIAIRQVPPLIHSEAARVMTDPAVLIVVQSNSWAGQIPTKIYEYLRTGNPVLVLAAERSAVWQFARQYTRCARLEFEDAAFNRKVIADLITDWRAGRLLQLPASDDTANLDKRTVGEEFVATVRSLFKATPRITQARPRLVQRHA